MVFCYINHRIHEISRKSICFFRGKKICVNLWNLWIKNSKKLDCLIFIRFCQILYFNREFLSTNKRYYLFSLILLGYWQLKNKFNNFPTANRGSNISWNAFISVICYTVFMICFYKLHFAGRNIAFWLYCRIAVFGCKCQFGQPKRMERCQSGRMGRSRKPLYSLGYRGFESLSLRLFWHLNSLKGNKIQN